MYESPINAYFGEVETQFDDAVFKAIQRVGIDVNKDELIKALAYDREQYERGYNDGLMFHPAIITNADRIRAMTDEELEVWLVNLCCASVGDAANARVQIIRGNLLNWLKQEVNE